MVLDLRRLRYVHAIAQNGSLTRAAEMLGVAQPALSHHLAELARRLRPSLTHRTARRNVGAAVRRILVAQCQSPVRS